jgi:hypothetical protein
MLALAACSAGARAARLSEGDAAGGVRTALERGAISAVGLLGRTDGFLGNPRVRIPLPSHLESLAKLMRALGQQHRVDEVVTAMNRAAEAAVPEGKALLVQAVRQMSVEDAWGIVRGGETSATEFFERKTREPLGEKFLPIVTQATQRVSLLRKFDALVHTKVGDLSSKTDEFSIERYVTDKALDGLFLMIGDEEKKIRQDPIGTGSAILRRVFGG